MSKRCISITVKNLWNKIIRKTLNVSVVRTFVHFFFFQFLFYFIFNNFKNVRKYDSVICSWSVSSSIRSHFILYDFCRFFVCIFCYLEIFTSSKRSYMWVVRLSFSSYIQTISLPIIKQSLLGMENVQWLFAMYLMEPSLRTCLCVDAPNWVVDYRTFNKE